MSPAEIIKAIDRSLLTIVEGVDPSTSKIVGNFLAVSGLVALPVYKISSSIKYLIDLEIKNDEGVTIGTLCFTSKFQDINPESLTRWQYVAFCRIVSIRK